jgi:hypothetical protein
MTTKAIHPSNQNNPIYYRRSLDKAQVADHDKKLILEIVTRSIDLANFMGQHIARIPPRLAINPAKTIIFQVDKEVLKRLLSNVEEVQPTYRISQEMRQRVGTCLTAVTGPLPSYSSPFVSADNSAIGRQLVFNLLMQYRQMKKFEQIPLKPPFETAFSCFSFVAFRLGLAAEADVFNRSQKKQPGNEQEAQQQRIDFFISKGYRFSPPPFQPHDIVILYSENKESKHAELVDKDTKKVCAKFGNEIPCGYLFDFDETPLEYGPLFRILRMR